LNSLNAHEELVALLPQRVFWRFLEPVPYGVRLVSEASPEVKFVVVDGDLPSSVPEFLALLPNVRVVQALSAGVDWLLPHIPHGVTLCTGRGLHDASVAEWVVASLLNLQRRLPSYWEMQRDAIWGDELPATIDVEDSSTPASLVGKRVLILGYGSIGRAVEARLKPFEVELLRVARSTADGVFSPHELPDLLASVDAVVVLLPLTPDTEGIVDARFLERMKEGAILLNAGRGRLVDTTALVHATASGRIRAAVDVTSPEPLPHDHPLWKSRNVLVTPHIAGATAGWRQRGYALVRDQLMRLTSGRPLLNVYQ
jgi:phosphoglycerate dehydrogenase-like enzyme